MWLWAQAALTQSLVMWYPKELFSPRHPKTGTANSTFRSRLTQAEVWAWSEWKEWFSEANSLRLWSLFIDIYIRGRGTSTTVHLQTKHRGSRNGSHHSLDSRAYSTEDRPLSRAWLSDLWTEGIISPRGVHCLSVFLEMPDNEPSEQQQTQQMATNGIFPVFIGRHMSSGNIMRKLSAAPVGSFMGFCLFLNFHIYCVSQACDGPAGDHPGPAPPPFF